MRRATRVLFGLVAAAFLVAAALVALLYAFQNRMIFPAPSGPTPFASSSTVLETIGTADGERLAALWHPPEPGEPTLVFLHGNGTAIATLDPVAEAWAREGYGFLVPAWRGYPGSTGRPSEPGVLLDAEAAFDLAAKRADGPLVVYGQSLGSGAAVHVATVRKPDALVLEAPYDSVLAVASARFPIVPVGALLRHPFRSDQRIGDVAAPILIVHGDADGVIPIAHGRALHALAPGDARFETVAGATHFNIGPLAHDRVVRFLREVLAFPKRPASG